MGPEIEVKYCIYVVSCMEARQKGENTTHMKQKRTGEKEQFYYTESNGKVKF